MSNILVIATETPSLTLRELATIADDEAYFAAIEEDRQHLSRHGDVTSAHYPTLEAVTQKRLWAGNKIRLGIWHNEDNFLGSINATPIENGNETEVGYWLRASAQGHGYATIAVRALTQYLQPRYARVFAEVHQDNEASKKVLQRSGYQYSGTVERDWGTALVFDAKK